MRYPHLVMKGWLMNSMKRLKGIVKADLKERTRNGGFLLVVAMSMISAYLFLPPRNSYFAVLDISGYRGIYNSAWVGASVAMSTVSLLFLLGFFYVKSAIQKDRQTGVGQIIASTPINRTTYIAGKFFSNLSILSVLVACSYVIAILMQLVRNENLTLNFIHITLPFLVVVVPVMFLVAAFAVLFESVNCLKGGFGNIIYFFIWAVLLKYETVHTVRIGRHAIDIHSIMGAEIFKNSMGERFTQLFPGVESEISEGLMFVEEPLLTFLWEGVSWHFELVAGRVVWLVAGAILVCVAAWCFQGFELSPQSKAQSIIVRRLKSYFGKAKPVNENLMSNLNGHACTLSPVSYQQGFFPLLVSELRLAIRLQKWWWALVQLSLIAACIGMPFQTAIQVAGPLSWCWPLLVWSSMGTREVTHGMQQIVFSSPFPIRRQGLALWVSGWIFSCFAGSGLLIRFIMERDSGGVMAWLVGSMFIPSLALALGVWTRTSRTFEVVFMIIMFMGVLNKVTYFDFMGVVEGSISTGMPLIYAMVTMLLLFLAVYGRKRQMNG